MREQKSQGLMDGWVFHLLFYNQNKHHVIAYVVGDNVKLLVDCARLHPTRPDADGWT